jgi:TonB family protein
MAEQPNLNQPANPDDHLSRLLVAEVEEPFYKTLIRDFKELINPPKLPPLEVTSQPVAVKDIWGMYGTNNKSFLMSTGFQILLVGIVVGLGMLKPVQTAVKKVVAVVVPVDVSEAKPVKPSPKAGGGGGDRSPTPASKGKLPPPKIRQFVPPSAVVNNTAPKLAMDPSILAPPDANLPNVNMANYGDPLGKIGPPSNGTGSGGGIGSGKGGGVGSGQGGGVGGGAGGGVYRAGNGVSQPVPLYHPEPEYSEDARKAKLQGSVLLYIEVDASGKVINPKVVKALGLGLDEKAIEAVLKWKFKPGMKDGKPVVVSATVEVNFRLL